MNNLVLRFCRTVGQSGTVAFSVIVFSIFLGCGSKQTNPKANFGTVEEAVKNALDSTVRLVIRDTDGNAREVGRGFFISPSLIATNFYVLNGVLGDERTVTSSTKYNIERLNGYAQPVGKDITYKIQSILCSVGHRLALIEVESHGAKPLPPGNSNKVQGNVVYVVRHSPGPEILFSKGIIKGRSHNRDRDRVYHMRASSAGMWSSDLTIHGLYFPQNNVEWLFLSTAISKEDSGGPVINSKGEVIGVSSHVSVSENGAISSATLGDFLRLKPMLDLVKQQMWRKDEN